MRQTATRREEFLLEGLLLARGAPDSVATWERWGGPYRVLRREVITTEWEEVEIA